MRVFFYKEIIMCKNPNSFIFISLLVLLDFHSLAYGSIESNGHVLKYFGQQNSAEVNISNPATSKILNYDSNIGSSGNIMYAKNGFSLSFPVDLNKATEEAKFNKGESSSLDYQFTFILKSFGLDLIYQKDTGFYLKDDEFKESKTNTSGVSSLVYKQYPSLYMERETVNFYYFSNPNGFSYNAAFTQSERQTSSGGSWVSMISLSNFSFHDSTSYIPTNYQDTYGKLKLGKAFGFSYLFGGAYTLAYGAPYFTVMFLAGPTRYNATFEYEDRVEKKNKENARTLGRVAVGYNGSTMIVTASFTLDQLSFKINNTKISPNAGVSQFSFGVRF